MAEKMIERKIDEAASFYGNAHIKNALKLDRDATFNEKCIPKFDAYALETAFLLGANFALSQQWVSVEEGLPEDNQNILIYTTYIGANDGKRRFLVEQYCYIKEYEKDGFRLKEGVERDIKLKVLAWMPIPPLPEARKQDEG